MEKRFLTYLPVKEQHEKIIIVASSPEAKKFKPIPGWTVIAVNNAIQITREHTDYWITIDPSDANVGIMNRKPFPAKYFCGVPKEFGTPYTRIKQLRRRRPTGVHYLERIHDDRNPLKARMGLCANKAQVSTGNSAYAALNLAYHMNPKYIVILGVNGDRHMAKFDGTYCRGQLNHLPQLFESSVNQLDQKGIKVYNANKFTSVKCFEYIDFEDLADL